MSNTQIYPCLSTSTIYSHHKFPLLNYSISFPLMASVRKFPSVFDQCIITQIDTIANKTFNVD